MGIHANKRGKFTGRKYGGRDFVQLYHYIVDTPEFDALPGNAVKMLVYLIRVYNGKNNGDLSPSDKRLKDRWKSNDTKTKATKELLEKGWIVKTRQGGMGIGPDLYALTFKPIDACDGKHSMPITGQPLNTWKQKKPTPDSGAEPYRIPVRERAA
jgi:hypothetical protein